MSRRLVALCAALVLTLAGLAPVAVAPPAPVVVLADTNWGTPGEP